MRVREEKENFIDKKFNKLRKDALYGTLPLNQNKIRSKDYANLIDKLNTNLKEQVIND